LKVRDRLRRWHIWLGWIVGAPLLLWTATGLFMTSFPIENVRGEHLVGQAPPLLLASLPVPPAIGGRLLASLSLEARSGGARWIVRYQDGSARLADPASGRLLPPLRAADARVIVEARYKGNARIIAVERTSSKSPPLELRREVPAWRVVFDDGARIYVHAETGEILARRTTLWRVYDFMWGLHILDPGGREDTNNGWLFGFALVSMVSLLIALVLLPMTLRRRRPASVADRQ
jgi:hypothetical protein